MKADAEPGASVLRLGLIGQGIQQSRTPAMHVAQGAALGLALNYVLFDVDRVDGAPGIERLLNDAETAGFSGVNVTHPFKTAAVACLDDLSEAARKLGAVNTVVFRDGRRVGHNTDYWGFAEALRRGLPDARLGTVLLLGAGGAGRAVAQALLDRGVRRLLILDRDAAAAANLVHRLEVPDGARAERVADTSGAVAVADGIVNATPMGMEAHPGTALDPALLKPRHWVADIVYVPLETALLHAARVRGCRTLSGAGMAVFQAVRAFELFTGRTPDPEIMRAAFEAAAPRVQARPNGTAG